MGSPESPEILIEKAKPGDVRGMQEVFYRSWLATYPNAEAGITIEDIEDRFRDRFSEEKLAKRAALYASPPEGETWLVAKKGNAVIGLVSPIRMFDRNQLQRIYVHPDYQRQGVGTKLWEAAKEYMDMSKDTYVELVDYNTQAVRFYEKLDFKDTGRRWLADKFSFRSGAKFPEMEMVLKAKA